MYLLFETIRLKDGELQNLPYHQARLNRSLLACFMKSNHYKLEELIKVPEYTSEGLYKCRFMYSDSDYKIEYKLYKPMKVEFLEVINQGQIEYKHKFTERSQFDILLKNTVYDDILISKNGHITDTTRANIVFLTEGKWMTPNKPLLHGTQRAKLLKGGEIEEREIMITDLNKFESFKLINAMNPFEEQPMYPITNIII